MPENATPASDADLGGEAPCYAHLQAQIHGDISGRSDVEDLMRDFFRQASMDDLLGPVFTAANVEWQIFLPKLADFWMWQLYGQRDYQGTPLRAHEASHARTPFTEAHFRRWFDLFDSAVDEQFSGPIAEKAKHRAHKMGDAMHRVLGVART
ncbi:MAG: group III truncated hemoglobin [Ilumatobacteraceae bacterium]